MSNNGGQKQDLRVTRTHKALVSALFMLLKKQPFQKITVNELCEAAMVSRATFYLHFEDKYHLLRFGLKQLRGEITCGDKKKDRETTLVK
ncbi:MAG: TetR/AcrR family transcriptional regulator, partial [Oscillospiraceae bacterium]|nr:TetR/AcrR family transcriptional regulator [Oscillospiraceae bacterium]